MTQDPLTPQDIERLSKEVNKQLAALYKSAETTEARWFFKGKKRLPKPQVDSVEKAVEEAGLEPETFWRQFPKTARKELCEEGGLLYAQMRRFGDVSSEKMISRFRDILILMGFAGNPLQVATVGLTVIVFYLGVRTWCEQTRDPNADSAEKGEK